MILGGHPHYMIKIDAQNGTVVEHLFLRPGVIGSWAYRFELQTPTKRSIKQDWVEPIKMH
jgi:hypothetical protein